MIRIFKGNDIKFVTKGVYKNIYASLGYKPIIEETKQKVVVQKPIDTKLDDENKLEGNNKTEESSKPKRKRGE